MTGALRTQTKQARVLVVEDVERLRDVLVTGIPRMGYAARGAASGEDALKIMEGDVHEIIVVDLNLPGMGGLEFFERVHGRWPETQGIVLTGFGDLEAARRAFRLDVVDFLSKPASLGDLEIAIDRAYRRLLHAIGHCPMEARPQPSTVAEQHHDRPRSLHDLERYHILEALKRNNGNRAATAKELGIGRRTLFYRLAEYQRQNTKPAAPRTKTGH